MYNQVVRHILAPIFDLSMGTKVMKCLKELEESQWWPREKILQLQNQRLRKLIKHVYEYVPYYRRIFEDRTLKPSDIECSTDLTKLPVLTKQIIRENYSSLVAKNISSGQMRKIYTSGSTGEPFMFYAEKRERTTRSYASSQRAYGWSGYRIGDKLVHIGETLEYHSTFEKIKETVKNYFERIKIFNVPAMFMGKIPLVAREIEDFQPEYIRGSPSIIYLIARFLEKEGTNKLRPKAILTIAEKVEDYQRDLFQKVFLCEAYSLYSTHEAPIIASECSRHSGYHITAENIIVEIVDNQSTPAPVGEEGSILVTNLYNYAMPFIRYDIGDVGAMSDQVCSCGRSLPILMKLDGRIQDSILIKDGRSIPGIALHQNFLARLEGVVQWQIVQESYEKVLVKVVLDRVYPKLHMHKLTSAIVAHFRPILGNDMVIIVEFVDQIPLTSSGKRRFIISKIADS
ncbi:phenylacetate--CoA ligase family protein [Chloroflexota bacterium]